MAKKFGPKIVIEVTDHGVSRVRVPYRTLADEAAGRELQARCAPVIQILSEVARGTAALDALNPWVPTPSEVAP